MGEVCTVNEQIDKYGSEKIDETCVDNEYLDACGLCDDSNIDYEDCDACQYLNASRTWLAMNIIALICVVIVALMISVGNFIPKLSDFAKYSKGLMFVAVILLFIGLMTYYIVADDQGVWNTDADTLYFGASGWLDVFAALCAIVGGALAILEIIGIKIIK